MKSYLPYILAALIVGLSFVCSRKAIEKNIKQLTTYTEQLSTRSSYGKK
jgi:hypothetical protein